MEKIATLRNVFEKTFDDLESKHKGKEEKDVSVTELMESEDAKPIVKNVSWFAEQRSKDFLFWLAKNKYSPAHGANWQFIEPHFIRLDANTHIKFTFEELYNQFLIENNLTDESK